MSTNGKRGSLHLVERRGHGLYFQYSVYASNVFLLPEEIQGLPFLSSCPNVALKRLSFRETFFRRVVEHVQPIDEQLDAARESGLDAAWNCTVRYSRAAPERYGTSCRIVPSPLLSSRTWLFGPIDSRRSARVAGGLPCAVFFS